MKDGWYVLVGGTSSAAVDYVDHTLALAELPSLMCVLCFVCTICICVAIVRVRLCDHIPMLTSVLSAIF